MHFEDDNDRKLVVLTGRPSNRLSAPVNMWMMAVGMASALGALFPSPLLAAMMILELGEAPKSYMECTVLMSIGACICFALYYELQGERLRMSSNSFHSEYVSRSHVLGSHIAPRRVLVYHVAGGPGLQELAADDWLRRGAHQRVAGARHFHLIRCPFLSSIVVPVSSG